MFSPEDFFTYGRWVGFTTIGFAGLAMMAFIFKWGFRFRLIGVTGFLGVLTGGLFSLSLVPFQHTIVPGATKFTLVYDTGASQAVIAVSPQISQSELEATLRQAANDLFSPGRMGRGQQQLTVRARTMIHPEPGMSEPLILGQVERSLFVREDPNMQVTLYTDNLARLPKPENS